MKPIIKLTLAILLTTSPVVLLAQDTTANDSHKITVEPTTKIIVQTEELKDLAKSYADAFSRLDSDHRINLVTRRDGKVWTIPDVKKLVAIGSVLVTENDAGKCIIPAKDVEFITDTGYTVAN